MAEIATHPYTKWQKSRPIPIPELKNCDPSERHLRTRHFLGVNPSGGLEAMRDLNTWILPASDSHLCFQIFSEIRQSVVT